MAKNSLYRPLPDGTMKDLKHAGDLSHNLVAAEYGKDERRTKIGRILEPPIKHDGRCAAATVVRGTILLGMVALLSLAVWREVGMWRMRSDMEELRNIVDGLRLNVNKLNGERSLLTDLNAYDDDEVFADLDGSVVVEDSFALPETRFHKSANTNEQSLVNVMREKGDIITEENKGDEMYDEDGEDETSGMYDDSERRTDERSIMVKSEEFLGKVLSVLPNDARNQDTSKIKMIRRMLHQDTALPQANEENFPIATHVADVNRNKRSPSLELPPEETVDENATPRFRYYKADHRRVQNKLPDEDAELITPVENAEARRRTRQSEDQWANGRRDFVAAHFHGNTSHLSTQTHTQYKGNGLVQVAHDAHHSVWSPAEWARAPHAPVLTRQGHVRVRKTGIYFVYVQIYYLDAHDISGWVLHRTANDGVEREPLLQCAAASPSEQPRDKPNSCYSAAALLLREGDRLAVRNTGGDRHSLMQPEKSFIGLIKLADTEEQPRDY